VLEPLPGIGLERLEKTLSEVSAALTNARATPGSSREVYNAYIQWANDSARKLALEVRAADVDRIILSKRYWHLQSMVEEGARGRLGNLLDAEFQERTRVVEDAVSTVKSEIVRWSQPGVLVVADTSFYITHPQKIEEADVASLLPIWEEKVRILVPILVVDELDGLKESRQSDVRWRAGYTLAVFYRILRVPSQPGPLRAEDFSAIDNATGGIPRGQVTVEILFDPAGHGRLPIADDEIVDRALAAQTLGGRGVTFLTYDTGQAMRARYAGLEAVKLTKEWGPETSARQ
jgi:hypothetical protein